MMWCTAIFSRSQFDLTLKLCRKRIVAGDIEPNAPVSREEARLISLEQKNKPKRKHRKSSHGKVSFRQLAREAARAWKALDEESRHALDLQAEVEKQNYQIRLRQWQEQEQERQEIAANEAALAQGMTQEDASRFRQLMQLQERIERELAQQLQARNTYEQSGECESYECNSPAETKLTLPILAAVSEETCPSFHAGTFFEDQEAPSQKPKNSLPMAHSRSLKDIMSLSMFADAANSGFDLGQSIDSQEMDDIFDENNFF